MRTRVFTVTGLSVIAGMVFLAVSGVRTFDSHEASLYERLGGETGVDGVVNHFLASVDRRRPARYRLRSDIDMALAPGVAERLGVRGRRSLPHRWDRPVAGAGEGAGFTEDAFDLVTRHFADAMFDAGVGAYEHFAAMRLFVDMLAISAFGDG